MAKILGTSGLVNGFCKKDRFLISLFIVLAIGILAGATSAGRVSNDEGSILFQIYSSFVKSRQEESFINLYLAVFLSEFLYLFASYVSGLCAVGMPVLFIIPLVYGAGKGIFLGFLYANSGFLGILNAIILRNIQTTLLSMLIIISLRKSYKMSCQAFANLNAQTSIITLTFKKYNQFYAVILTIAAVICLIDALLLKINLFN